MAGNVDVLAVMDSYLNSILPGKLWDGTNPYCNRPGRDGSEYLNDCRKLYEARDAVAGLIKAAENLRAEARRLHGDAIPSDTLADFDAAIANVR